MGSMLGSCGNLFSGNNAKIAYDPRYTWATLDVVEKGGGIPVRARVGHSYIKKTMRETDAVFCGEASGHTYFKDFFFADFTFLT